MKTNLLLTLAIILTISITSCKTEDTDTNPPVITLTTPVSEQDYAIGDTIFIQGDVTDNEALHELMIMLHKQETGEVVMHYTPVVHDMESFHIDTFFVPTDIVHIHYHLKVEAWDHDNNKAELEYTLHWAD